MSGDPSRPIETARKPMTVALVTVGVALAGLFPILFALLPPEAQPWNFSIIGAVALFAGARLGFWPAVAFAFMAIGLKDFSYFLLRGYRPSPTSYLYFAAYVAIGRQFLRQTESPWRIGLGAFSASLVFFLVSNFESWLNQSLPYGYSLGGLLDCYAAGLPFYRGTFTGDMLFSAGLFGASAVLSRAYFPAERVVPMTAEQCAALPVEQSDDW